MLDLQNGHYKGFRCCIYPRSLKITKEKKGNIKDTTGLGAGGEVAAGVLVVWEGVVGLVKEEN